jgi:hypothetical protein
MDTILIFLDTEFTTLTQRAELISLALVAETGETFYAESTSFDIHHVSEWVEKNVLRKLLLRQSNYTDLKKMEVKGTHEEIATALKIWFAQFPLVSLKDNTVVANLQIWADNYTWDWLLFTELFGGALKLPKNISYIPMDLCTWLQAKGINPDVEREKLVNIKELGFDFVKHNALHDAHLIKFIYNSLT